MACEHTDTQEGPRIPLAYGSSPTLLCKDCFHWTQDRYGPHKWRSPETLIPALIDDKDER